jgi:hypothetical protein
MKATYEISVGYHHPKQREVQKTGSGITDTRTNRQTDGQTDTRTDRQTYKQTDTRTDRQTHVQADRQTDTRTSRQTDGQTKGKVIVPFSKGARGFKDIYSYSFHPY